MAKQQSCSQICGRPFSIGSRRLQGGKRTCGSDSAATDFSAMADALCALSVREYQCGRLPRNNREPRHAVANAQRRSDRMDRSAGCGVHQTSGPDLQTRCWVPHLEPEQRHAAVLPRARSRFGLSATSGLKTFIPIFIPCQPLRVIVTLI